MTIQHTLKLRWLAAALTLGALPGQAATNTEAFFTDMRCGEVRARMVSVCLSPPEENSYPHCFSQTLEFPATLKAPAKSKVILQSKDPKEALFPWYAFAWSCTKASKPQLLIHLTNLEYQRDEKLLIFNQDGSRGNFKAWSQKTPFAYTTIQSIKTSANE